MVVEGRSNRESLMRLASMTSGALSPRGSSWSVAGHRWGPRLEL